MSGENLAGYINEQAVIEGNIQYLFGLPEVKLVRDAVEGEPAIKRDENKEVYLPNPSDAENQDDKRYERFIGEAEYDNFPDRTLSGYLGALFRKPVDIDNLPEVLSYMEKDSDGDGLSLQESIEITASNLIQVKYHGLFTSYEGYTPDSIDTESITKQEAERLGLKAYIKHYPRESVMDWDYSVVNGVKQLTFVKLHEQERQINPETLLSEYYDIYLLLGIDEDGHYYQEKLVKKFDAPLDRLERVYPESRGQKMRSIPFEFVIEQRRRGSSVPRQLGILYPICKKAIYRYQVNAKLKEVMRIAGQPTTYSSGWTESKAALFKTMTGLDTIKLGIGSHMPLPEGATVDFLQWDANADPMFKYLEQNEKTAKALGARFDTENASNEAVGVVEIRSSEELSALINVASSCEEGYRRSLSYAYQMMTDSGELEDVKDFKILINRDFNQVKLTAAEEKQILDSYTGMLISRQEAVRRLERGGVLTVDAETLLTELDNTIV